MLGGNQTGEKRWAFDAGDRIDSDPIVSDGYVYFGANKKIYCIKAEQGDTGSWPMFKYNAARTGAK